MNWYERNEPREFSTASLARNASSNGTRPTAFEAAKRLRTRSFAGAPQVSLALRIRREYFVQRISACKVGLPGRLNAGARYRAQFYSRPPLAKLASRRCVDRLAVARTRSSIAKRRIQEPCLHARHPQKWAVRKYSLRMRRARENLRRACKTAGAQSFGRSRTRGTSALDDGILGERRCAKLARFVPFIPIHPGSMRMISKVWLCLFAAIFLIPTALPAQNERNGAAQGSPWTICCNCGRSMTRR